MTYQVNHFKEPFKSKMRNGKGKKINQSKKKKNSNSCPDIFCTHYLQGHYAKNFSLSSISGEEKKQKRGRNGRQEKGKKLMKPRKPNSEINVTKRRTKDRRRFIFHNSEHNNQKMRTSKIGAYLRCTIELSAFLVYLDFISNFRLTFL